MSYDIEWTKPASKALQRLDKHTQKKIYQAVDDFIKEKSVNIKKIKTRKDEWRIAVDDWRIIFEKDSQKNKFRIHDVVDRKDAYKYL
ncbi:MAG: type II toxin-antitoxin system RelE/ParE family toxin [Candidatus Xenobiia bacterium LiM19]|jgi:mRNA-degrading endonuclease RelE of RelBE toxin-antitoxin system